MKHWKSIVAVCAIFIFGLTCGVLVTLRVIDHKLQNVARGGPEAVRALVLQRLTRQLHLSDEQRQKVSAITEKAMRQLVDARRRVAPEAGQAMEHAESDIRAVLTPGQAEKFDQMAQRRRVFWQAGDGQ